MSDVLEQLFVRQSVAVAICELGDGRATLLRANDAWTALVGAEQDALLTSLSFDSLRASLAASRDIELEPFVTFADGPLQLLVLPLDARRFALEVREVDPRVRHAHVLARSHERLELAVAAGAMFVWDIDLVSGEVYWDGRFSELTGYPLEELARLDRDIYHPDDRDLVFQARLDHLAGKTPMISFEARVVTRANTTLWLSVQGRVVESDADGTARRLTGVARDLTARKELEQRVAVAERMASIGTLAAGIGHEINNPLTFVTASLSLLREELATLEREHGLMLGELPSPRPAFGGSAKLGDLLADASEGAERIRSIVERLRSMSTLDAVKRSDIDVPAVLAQALKISEHQLRHRAKLVCDIAKVPPVSATEGELLQVFINLLVNAAQAIPAGRADENVIRVVCTSDGGKVVVEISDTGEGVAPELRARIFDPFFTTRHVGEGTGLGLSISRGIVQRLGGDLSADSTPHVGSSFRVTLPIAPSAVVQSMPARRLRLLVVDDEPAIPRIVARALAAHEVVVHNDPTRALSELRAGARFDGILLDVMMPAMTGIEFHAALAAIDPTQQDHVAFMSGGAFTRETQVFLEHTTRPQLAKPFSVAELKAVVARLAAGD